MAWPSGLSGVPLAEDHQQQVCAPSQRLLPPPLLVGRSNNHIYGQVIDDSKGSVIASASTTETDLKDTNGGNIAAATVVGKRLGERALAKGITTVHFDRNGRPYHGRVQALAEAAREGGLSF